MPEKPAGLLSLDVENFRNIESASLTFSRGLNLITGNNAAGKTSLLEAIYCLGRVRSFRTSSSNQLIRDGQPHYRLIGGIALGKDRSIRIGIERHRGHYQVRLGGQVVRRLSDLAGHFPVQVMTGDTDNILSGGPRYRRQSLDWALFHVEQRYRSTWQRYTRVLRQRNAALRSHAPAREVQSWDAELVDAAMILDQQRKDYLSALEPHVQVELSALLSGRSLEIRYQPGWSADKSLEQALNQSIERDLALGYTQQGPHRADYILQVDGKALSSHFSRGQQKAIVLAFLMGQVTVQHTIGAAPGVFLLDDLGSEMDPEHQARTLDCLTKLHTQVFVTAIETGGLDLGPWPDTRRFHVEHGEIREVL